MSSSTVEPSKAPRKKWNTGVNFTGSRITEASILELRGDRAGGMTMHALKQKYRVGNSRLYELLYADKPRTSEGGVVRPSMLLASDGNGTVADAERLLLERSDPHIKAVSPVSQDTIRQLDASVADLTRTTANLTITSKHTEEQPQQTC